MDATVRQVLDNQRRLREVSDRRDASAERVAELAPWGDLSFPPESALGGIKLWFYIVPRRQLGQLAALDLPWQEVHRDNRQVWIVILHPDEPPRDALPVPRTRTGALGISEVRRRLEAAEVELEEVQAGDLWSVAGPGGHRRGFRGVRLRLRAGVGWGDRPMSKGVSRGGDAADQLASSGVEALIERLRAEGVEAGRVEAERRGASADLQRLLLGAMTAPDPDRADAPARLVEVQESLATIDAGWKGGARRALKKNELIFLLPRRLAPNGRQERLKAEVLRVRGDLADVQVFEDTRGISIGDPVEQGSEMLSVRDRISHAQSFATEEHG